MGRNLDRRVETVVPVLDPAIAKMIVDDIVDVFVNDNVKSRTLNADGSYDRRLAADGEPRVDAQQIFLERYEAV
jgi:polyphosphate kinase